MEYSKYSETEILSALKRVDDGLPVHMLCSELEISFSTYKTWLLWRDEAQLKAIARLETHLLMERLRQVEAQNLLLQQKQLHEYQKAKRLKDDPEMT